MALSWTWPVNCTPSAVQVAPSPKARLEQSCETAPPAVIHTRGVPSGSLSGKKVVLSA